MKKFIVAVIGEAEASAETIAIAQEAGERIARHGWTLVTGGLSGVMEAASRGAAKAGGIVVGILPQGETRHANPHVAIPIATNMGYARNAIIAHTADALIAVGGAYGTLSEIAFARKLGKPVFGIKSWEIEGVVPVDGAAAAVEACQRYFAAGPSAPPEKK